MVSRGSIRSQYPKSSNLGHLQRQLPYLIFQELKDQTFARRSICPHHQPIPSTRLIRVNSTRHTMSLLGCYWSHSTGKYILTYIARAFEDLLNNFITSGLLSMLSMNRKSNMIIKARTGILMTYPPPPECGERWARYSTI